MSGLQPGEVVDISIRGARVVEVESEHLVVLVDADDGGAPHRIYVAPRIGSSVKVERVAPAQWPPQPGDVWQADMAPYTAYFFCRDVSDLGDEAPGTTLSMIGVSEYADGTYVPDVLIRRFRLRLVYRPEPATGELSADVTSAGGGQP